MKKQRIVLFGLLMLTIGNTWALTDITSPSGSGLITLSSYFSTYNKPFDNDFTTLNGRWVTTKAALPAYAQFQFTNGQSYVVTTYRVWSAATSARAPRDFALSASSNGTDWVELDSRSDESGWADWDSRTYTCTNANMTPFSYFRFTVTANNGDGSYMNLAELEFFESDEVTAAATNPSPTNATTNVKVVPTLAWSGNGISYDVFFGTDNPLGESDFKTNVTFPAFSPGVLDYTTTYYWRIDSKGMDNVVTGETWSFTTTNPPPALTAGENFESYPIANLDGVGAAGGGWQGAWSALANVSVVATTLQYQAGQISIHGGQRAVRISQGDASSVLRRDFTTQEGGHLYFSMLVQANNPRGRRLAAGLKNSADGATYWQSGGFHFVYPNDAISAEVYDGSNAGRASTGIVPNSNETYFIVARLERTGADLEFDRARILVNPTSRTEPETGWTAVTYSSAAIGLLNRFTVRILYTTADDAYLIDEIRIGTTYEAVVSEAPVKGTVILIH